MVILMVSASYQTNQKTWGGYVSGLTPMLQPTSPLWTHSDCSECDLLSSQPLATCVHFFLTCHRTNRVKGVKIGAALINTALAIPVARLINHLRARYAQSNLLVVPSVTETN